MYDLKKIQKYNVKQLIQVAAILYECGKDMAKKFDLHHWDNPYIKSLVIVGVCALKNDIYLVYDKGKAVATFQTKKKNNEFHFEKLASLPSESGKGVGTFSLSRIETIAIKQGCHKVTMEVFQPSRHAIVFYQKRGYRISGTTETPKYKEYKMEKSV